MKRWLLGLSLVLVVSQEACALEWLTDLPTALGRARKENKVVLLDFTGSDWCGWCMKLKREVFDQLEFAGYANANLIMVEVDFPKRKSLSLEQVNANSALAAKYSVDGYPTIIVLDSDGRRIGQTGYMPGGPSAFIAELERFPGMPHRGQSAVRVANSSASAQPVAPQPAALAPVPAARYGELTLKGISGGGNRRMALINNETMMMGEAANVKTLDTTVPVTLKEIRDDSVVIVVNGQTRELKLAHP
jgi:thioredoxin-related protein